MTGLAKNRKVAKKIEKKVAILMDKLSRIGKVAEFREWPILDFSRDKLSRKRAKFAKLAKVYLAKVNPVKVVNPLKTEWSFQESRNPKSKDNIFYLKKKIKFQLGIWEIR